VAQQASQVLTPLRDLFAAVFFVFFGLTTDASELLVMLGPAIALSAATMATKIATGYLAAVRGRIGVPGGGGPGSPSPRAGSSRSSLPVSP
jgi:Kef-type K+ transport systems, membrane components